MKGLFIGLASLVVVVVLYLAWIGNAPASPLAPGEQNPPSITKASFATTTESYSIQLEYPVFGVEAADKHVESIIDEVLTNFTTMPPNPTPIDTGNELNGQFDSAYVGADLMSAKMLIYEFTGGAHGGTVAYGLNFRPDGTEVTLEEALGLIGKNLTEVSQEATKQLTEKFGMVQFPEGATPTPENYATFVIGKDTVTFIFQQYQVEAYAAGMPEIVFPRVK